MDATCDAEMVWDGDARAREYACGVAGVSGAQKKKGFVCTVHTAITNHVVT